MLVVSMASIEWRTWLNLYPANELQVMRWNKIKDIHRYLHRENGSWETLSTAFGCVTFRVPTTLAVVSGCCHCTSRTSPDESARTEDNVG